MTVDLGALTPRQQEVYHYIARMIRELGYAPSIRQIGNEFGIRSPNGVIYHLRVLERKGYIERHPNAPRAIYLLHDARRVPISGTVSAGAPREAINENREVFDGFDDQRHVVVPARDLLRTPVTLLGSKRIQATDYLVLREQSTAKEGQLALTLGRRGTLQAVQCTGNEPFMRRGRDSLQVHQGTPRLLGIIVGVIQQLPGARCRVLAHRVA